MDNKLQKRLTILSQYEKVLSIKKLKVLEVVSLLENYKMRLKLEMKTIFPHVTVFFGEKGNFFKSNKNKEVSAVEEKALHIFAFAPEKSGFSLHNKIKQLLVNNNNLIKVICSPDQIDNTNKEIYDKSPNVEILYRRFTAPTQQRKLEKAMNQYLFNKDPELLDWQRTNIVIATIIDLVDFYVNEKQIATKAFFSSNFRRYDIFDIQIAPIFDERKDFAQLNEMQIYAEQQEKKISTFIPTKGQWLYDMVKYFIWIKLKVEFVELIQHREMLKVMEIDNNIDVLEKEVEELNSNILSKKMLESNEELALFQSNIVKKINSKNKFLSSHFDDGLDANNYDSNANYTSYDSYDDYQDDYYQDDDYYGDFQNEYDDENDYFYQGNGQNYDGYGEEYNGEFDGNNSQGGY